VEPQLLTVGEGVYAWIGAGGDSNAGAIDTRMASSRSTPSNTRGWRGNFAPRSKPRPASRSAC